MDFLLLLLQIELVLIALLFVPILMTRYHLNRRRPLKALTWAKFTLNVGRVLPTWRGVGNSGVAVCYIQADDFAAAQPYAERAAAYYEENTAKRLNAHRAVALANLGITLSRSGQMEQAEQRLDAALKIGVRNPAIRAMTEIYAANVYLNRGRLTDAARLMQEVLASPKLSEDYRVSAENLLAMQKYFTEDFAGGLALARQAMQRKASPDGIYYRRHDYGAGLPDRAWRFAGSADIRSGRSGADSGRAAQYSGVRAAGKRDAGAETRQS